MVENATASAGPKRARIAEVAEHVNQPDHGASHTERRCVPCSVLPERGALSVPDTHLGHLELDRLAELFEVHPVDRHHQALLQEFVINLGEQNANASSPSRRATSANSTS